MAQSIIFFVGLFFFDKTMPVKLFLGAWNSGKTTAAVDCFRKHKETKGEAAITKVIASDEATFKRYLSEPTAKNSFLVHDADTAKQPQPFLDIEDENAVVVVDSNYFYLYCHMDCWQRLMNIMEGKEHSKTLFIVVSLYDPRRSQRDVSVVYNYRLHPCNTETTSANANYSVIIHFSE
jgi:hypothetical protein